ncbi:MAG TPA: rhomboid family intramembrane serine protease [Acidobacteriaceae bacterium]|jgi:membrane associated rhomboid family serine protease|nr:rhomboid family intramembrane serine protease [Acidobacteriaceae bacterium]
MPRSTPTTISFPPFAGTVRKLVLANVAVFFAFLLINLFSPAIGLTLLNHLWLKPASVAVGQIWELVTYSFLHLDILSILFTMLTLWFCGSLLEGAYGRRWFTELYFTSVIGGAVLASAISFTGILHLSPDVPVTGAWGGLFGVLIAIAMRMGDIEFMLFPLPFQIRAKYMVAIDLLIALAIVLRANGAMGAAVELAGALAGFLYVQFAPRRGLALGFSEQYFGLRNAYYKAKRRRAAKKFEVYMGKQGRQVKFDEEGRYIDPDDPRRRDPNDKRWMN